MPFRNGKISGVLNNNDSSTNEMSYVDMHDLHPENVQAAQVHGAVSGAMSGAWMAAIPAAIAASFTGSKIKEIGEGVEHLIGEEASHVRFTGKSLGIGAAIIAAGAVVMGTVRAYTAKKDAETHNAWSDRVLARMEAKEAAEASLHTAALTAEREKAALGGPQQAGK